MRVLSNRVVPVAVSTVAILLGVAPMSYVTASELGDIVARIDYGFYVGDRRLIQAARSELDEVARRVHHGRDARLFEAAPESDHPIPRVVEGWVRRAESDADAESQSGVRGRIRVGSGALDGIPTDVGVPASDNPATEAARKAMMESIRGSCSVPLSDAIDVQAKHSANFMVTCSCKEGSIGAECQKTMMV